MNPPPNKIPPPDEVLLFNFIFPELIESIKQTIKNYEKLGGNDTFAFIAAIVTTQVIEFLKFLLDNGPEYSDLLQLAREVYISHER